MPFGDFLHKLLQDVGIGDPNQPPPPPPTSNEDQINQMVAMIQAAQSQTNQSGGGGLPYAGGQPKPGAPTGTGPIPLPWTPPNAQPLPLPNTPANAAALPLPYSPTPQGVANAQNPVIQNLNAGQTITPQMMVQYLQQAQQANLARYQHGGPGGLGNLAGDLSGGARAGVGGLWGIEKDMLSSIKDDPLGAPFAAMAQLDRPRQEVVEDMGNQAYYQATHNGEKPNAGLSWNPYVGLSNILPDSFLVAWANDPANWPLIKKVYEEGYTVWKKSGKTDANGDPIMVAEKTFPPGGRAVWELYVANNGSIAKIMADVAFDPLTAAGGVGKGAGAVGRGAEALGKAEEAARAARVAEFGGIVPKTGALTSIAREVIGPLGKGTETLPHAADVAPGKAMLDFPKYLIGEVAGDVNFLTRGAAGRAALNNPAADAIRYLAGPAARTLAERGNRDLGDALNAVARSATGLWDAAKGTAPTVGTKAYSTATDAVPSSAVPVPGAGVADNAVADAAKTAPPVDPAFPAPAPHPYGLDQATVDQLGYLAPKADGDRFVDQVFAGLAQTDPSAQQQFLERYLPLAQKHIQEMDAIELARARAAKQGKNLDRFAIDKPLTSARHVAEDLMPIAREVLGTDTPAYRFMNDELGDTFKILRDETGKVLMSKADLRALDPKIQRLIEDAVFGTDTQLATDARFFLRQQGNKKLQKVADELKRLRELVHGPEGADAVRKAPVEKGSTYQEVFGDLPDDVQSARWMDEQEAASLKEMGQPIPKDLQDRLAQPLPPKEPRPLTVDDVVPPTKPDPLADLREGLDQPSKPLSGKKPAGAAFVPGPSANPVKDGLDRAVEIGDLTQEQADLLNTTVYFDNKGKRFTGSPVNDPKDLKPVLDKKTGAFVNPIPKQDLTEKRIIEVYVEHLRSGMTPQQAKDAAFDALKQSSGRVLADSNSRMGRGLGMALHAYDTMTAAVREHIMYNIFTGPRGVATDQIGDAIQLVSQGDTALAARTFDPRKWITEFGTVRKPGAEAAAAMAETSVGQTMDRLGLAVPSGFMPNVGREEVARSGAMSIPRLIEHITGSETAGKITGYATGWLASRNIRDFRTALERVRRFTTFGDALDTGLVDARERFVTQVQELGAAKGVDVTGMIDNLGDEFSPKDVRTFGRQAGLSDGDAFQLAKQWRSEVNGLQKSAMETTNKKLFSYEATKADEALKRVFLFHYWITRATPRYAETMIRNPEVAVNFYRATEGLKRAAEGQPRSVQGLMNVMSGPAGYNLFMNPTALIGTALMFRDQAVDDGQDRLFDRFLKNSGGFMNPLMESGMVAAGWINDEAADPFASYSTRNTLMGIAQYGVSKGWLGENRLLTDPYENTKRRIMGATSQFASDIYVPGAQPLHPGDPQASTKSMISNDIISRVQQQYGLDPAIPLDEWPVAAQQTLNDSQAAFLEHKSGNTITDAAVSAYASANLESRLGGLVVAGGLRLRNEDRDARMMAASAGDDTQRTFRDLGNAGSPAAVALDIGEANVNAVGKQVPQIGVPAETDQVAQGKLTNKQYNAIKFGEPTQVMVGGHMFSAAELAALSDDERGIVADQWLAEQGGSLDQQAFYDARDKVLAQPINAPYGEFLDARTAMSKIGAEDLAKRSPAYANYLDRLPEQTRNDPGAFGAASMSPEAYLATQGEKGSVYDPLSLGDTFDPTQADPLATAQAATAATPAAQTREQRLAAQMQRYQGDAALFNQTLQQYTGVENATLENMNPQLRQAMEWHLAQAGVSAPSMPQDVEMYQRWVGLQPRGADTSIAAYYRWTDKVLAGQQ